MVQLPDDPVIACMMRTGYPPWFQYFERMEETVEREEETDDDSQEDGV